MIYLKIGMLINIVNMQMCVIITRYGRMYEWMNKWMNERTNERMNEWINEWIL